MKKLFSIIAVITCLLGFTENAGAQIISLPPIYVTRISDGGSADAVALTIQFRKPSGLFTISETKTFPAPSATPVAYTSTAPASSSMTFTASIDGLTSASAYPLPTVVNTSTIIPASDCGMTNYKLSYGYGIAITCTGTNQYTVRATKLLCDPENPCTPCGGVTLR